MTEFEREQILGLLQTSLECLERTVAACPGEMLTTRGATGGWTVIEILEHIDLVETSLLQSVHKALASSATEEALMFAKGRDELILSGVRNRRRFAEAPPDFHPLGRHSSLEAAMTAFRTTRAQTLEFVRTTQHDLRRHTFPHFILRDMDAYQWLLFIAAHTDRHTAQIEHLHSRTCP